MVRVTWVKIMGERSNPRREKTLGDFFSICLNLDWQSYPLPLLLEVAIPRDNKCMQAGLDTTVIEKRE